MTFLAHSSCGVRALKTLSDFILALTVFRLVPEAYGGA